eukprot:TRINITY_DN35987_c4_g1_i1.p1 TRINITY_DN35987_c4_g1~~TRINITY_DN35987_c4_g1_i1.p1  ORF type:complete len:104 (-),score=18.21 TRINITY_DN35987_c4_g1_i1:54-365(-)
MAAWQQVPLQLLVGASPNVSFHSFCLLLVALCSATATTTAAAVTASGVQLEKTDRNFLSTEFMVCSTNQALLATSSFGYFAVSNSNLAISNNHQNKLSYRSCP